MNFGWTCSDHIRYYAHFIDEETKAQKISLIYLRSPWWMSIGAKIKTLTMLISQEFWPLHFEGLLRRICTWYLSAEERELQTEGALCAGLRGMKACDQLGKQSSKGLMRIRVRLEQPRGRRRLKPGFEKPWHHGQEFGLDLWGSRWPLESFPWGMTIIMWVITECSAGTTD